MNISGCTVRFGRAVGFSVVCGLLLLVMTIGAVSTGKLNGETREIVDVRVPKMDASHTIVLRTNAQAIALRNLMLKEVKDERAKFVAVQATLVAMAMADKVDDAKVFLASQIRPILSA